MTPIPAPDVDRLRRRLARLAIEVWAIAFILWGYVLLTWGWPT